MADEITQASAPARFPRLSRPDPWSLGAVLIAALVLMPIGSVLWMALTPEDNIWPHLIATTLPRYLGNTGVLMAGTALLAAAVGTGAAWLVSVYRFPGARWLEWLLLMPLAIPAYVGAYALVDFLEYAGPVQSGLRALFGWDSARDYWFPEIRSRGAAVVVLAAALYPYVYLLSRAAFREQSGGAYEVARALGAGPFALFARVGLPLARPAIAAGAALVMMETVNDFGVVDYFAVQTLTTGIFSVWLESGNAGGAAQIATLILALILVLVTLEKTSRRNLRFHNLGRHHRPLVPARLSGAAAWAATIACALPVAVGFVLPVGVIAHHALANPEAWAAPGLLSALGNTLTVGGLAALGTVTAGLFLVYGVRLSGRALPRLLLPVTTIGYAAPGAVLGVGILIPMAAADNALADGVERLLGIDIGLVLTGSAFAIIYAYGVRFFAIAQGAADAAMGRIAPSLPMAARSLGRTARGTLAEVYLPLIRGSVGTALLLVFVDCVKELPATLLLRPFNFNTLSTRVYEQASLENLGDAAPAALLVSAVGLVAVGFLARANR
ncbi:ABC transporter permease [Rhodovulum adriaticum]|uniref:Iron(III) transport system permease protein n=1 Tax=Rhodovulum adriaticum TaxID=35804 RepID=A0A4R2NPE7_RHOAD|nr:iron ABC transporter permease [Rhodovulum adriaticum]MBK1634437.1 iron ABC transporter permease [Rhodovulum adriaticum]TCP23194.1 iron(III) transport system permease protein [Rhodovulum adriaticum]